MTITVINVHNLIHLTDDVINMNCSLIEMSAYAFENHLGMVIKVVHAPHVLAQYCRRIHEKNL